ncbi:hypothetical protein [Lysobacter sp. CA196]|uniref:hypothetical protein n=1 Tax=Lysobacter sp. CA196 TaxID=3455606 RepID=UPI003F8D82DB
MTVYANRFHEADVSTIESSTSDAADSAPLLEVLDLDSELTYWRNHYRGLIDRPGLRYSDYEPAVKVGLDAYMRSRGRTLEEMQDGIGVCYRRTRGASRLDWDEARTVVEAAWSRLEHRTSRP